MRMLSRQGRLEYKIRKERGSDLSNGLQFFSDRSAFVTAAPGIDLPVLPVTLQWNESTALTSGHVFGGPVEANGRVTISISTPSLVTAFSCTLNAAGTSACSVDVSLTMTDGSTASKSFDLQPGTPQFFGIQSPAPITTIAFNASGQSGQTLYAISNVASMTCIAKKQIFPDSAAFMQALAFPSPHSPSAPTLQWSLGDAFITPAPFAGPVTVTGSTSSAPIGGALLRAYGCMISARANSSASLAVTTADGAVQQQPLDLTMSPQFVGAVAGTSAISSVAVQTPAGAQQFLTVSNILTMITDASASVLVYPAQTFAQLFPNTTKVDFSNGNIPGEFGKASGPLNSQTNDGFYSPGMIGPNVSFNVTGRYNFCYFNNPSYLGFASGKGVAAAEAAAAIVIDVSQQPAQAAGLNVVEFGGRGGSYVITVTGSDWSATFNLPAPAKSQLFVGIRATRTKIHTVSVARGISDVGAFGINQFGWV
jgi:hypothetical protein